VIDARIVQRFVDADLIGAERAAALEDEHNLTDVPLEIQWRLSGLLPCFDQGRLGGEDPRGIAATLEANSLGSGSGLSVDGMREPVRPVINRVPRWKVT